MSFIAAIAKPSARYLLLLLSLILFRRYLSKPTKMRYPDVLPALLKPMAGEAPSIDPGVPMLMTQSVVSFWAGYGQSQIASIP